MPQSVGSSERKTSLIEGSLVPPLNRTKGEKLSTLILENQPFRPNEVKLFESRKSLGKQRRLFAATRAQAKEDFEFRILICEVPKIGTRKTGVFRGYGVSE